MDTKETTLSHPPKLEIVDGKLKAPEKVRLAIGSIIALGMLNPETSAYAGTLAGDFGRIDQQFHIAGIKGRAISPKDMRDLQENIDNFNRSIASLRGQVRRQIRKSAAGLVA
ncbi:MAG: hypothetical protein V1936_01085 [Patescibacteria group bacterium]